MACIIAKMDLLWNVPVECANGIVMAYSIAKMVLL
jgi:hypothetical protein